MICPRCHESNPTGAEFCLNCGARFSQQPPFESEKKSTALCPKCQEPCPPGSLYCLTCGTRIDTPSAAKPRTAPPAQSQPTSVKHKLPPIKNDVPQRYSSIRTITLVYRVLSIIVSIIALYLAFRIYPTLGFSGAIITWFLGAIPSTLLYSSGDRLAVIVDTEENTRRSAEYLRQILEAQRNEEER